MGTNYYVRPDACPTCGRGGTVHMCKSLRMWQAITQGSDGWDLVGDLRTWNDWRQYLLTERPTIVDEYDDTHDIDQFIAEVEAVEPEQRRRQYDAVVAGPWDASDEYLCPDGFSFSRREFS